MIIHTLLCFCSVIAGIRCNIDELDPAANVKLVFVGFRHAYRNPGQFLKDDPNAGKWGLEGEAMLNSIGKKQAYAYGKQLRNRYGDLIDSNWKPEETKVFSSNADRVQGSVQITMAGLFPPQDYADWSDELKWQPVSYTIDNVLLRMYAIKCPTSDNTRAMIYSGGTPEGAKLLEENKDVIDFVASKTGLEPKLEDMADVVDNLEGMIIRGLDLPEWIETNPFNRSILEDIQRLSEAPEVLCSKHETCRRIMAGYWLNHIYNNLNESSAVDGPLDTKMFIYGTHNEIMTSLLWLLGYERQNGVYHDGSGILEYRDNPDKAVRLIYSQPTPEDPVKRNSEIIKMNFCEGEEWCPLDTFLQAISERTFSDWESECGLPDCACAAAEEAKKNGYR